MALLAMVPGCRRPGAGVGAVLPAEIILRRQVQELQNLAEFARHSPLVPFDQALVTVHESLLQDLLSAALPYENVIDQRFRVRVLNATVTCDDGLALVRLDGRASFADRPEADAFVEATVWGVLEEFDLEPEENALRGRVNVIAFETRRAELFGGEHRTVRGLIHDLARVRIEAFAGTDYTFEIPVRLVREVVLPEIVSKDVRIREARMPLAVSVIDVKAFRRKLWISVRLYPEDKDAALPTADSSGTGAR